MWGGGGACGRGRVKKKSEIGRIGEGALSGQPRLCMTDHSAAVHCEVTSHCLAAAATAAAAAVAAAGEYPVFMDLYFFF